MKVGDLITHCATLHIVVSIKQTTPVAKRGMESVVLKNLATLETRTVPMKWLRG